MKKWMIEEAVRKYTVWGRKHPDKSLDLEKENKVESYNEEDDEDEIYNC